MNGSQHRTHLRGYLAARQRFNEEKDDLELVERAAHFMFINRHAYNGLTRYNLLGGINTSYGKYKAPYLPAKEIKACHAVATRCEFAHQSFQSSLDCAGPSDVIFCDPPYEPLEGKKASRLMPLVDLVLKISRP